MNVLLHTFGCKANQYDSEVVRQRLEASGCTVVTDPALADAAVVNSCTVTHVGEAKLRGFVRRIARRNPDIQTVVMGCAAALDDGRIAALPSVSSVVGGADPGQVAAALGLDEAADAPLQEFASSSRAWLKVQDGCDEHCTFCATTLARGDNRSRDPQAVVAEATLLARHHAEIVLTGVHIGTYGRDTWDGRDGGVPPHPSYPSSLSSLVALLIERVPDVRFRLSSVEATEVDALMERLMTDAPGRLAPHLHAPLQSGSDRVLRRMGRHWYSAGAYRDRIETLAANVRPLGLGADVIVGFPGETDDDHRRTVALIEALPFTYLHVFPYSPRQGTAAPRLGDPPPPAVVKERGAELRALAERKARAYRCARAGTPADLVLEGRMAHWREAITEDYLPVRVPADAAWVVGRQRVMARLAGGPSQLTADAA